MKFYKDLYFGMWNDDVKRLQTCLSLLGYGSFKATGFYGNKTMNAVAAFQRDNKIDPAYGFFGPVTRPVFESKLFTANRDLFWQTAVSCLGTDASPNDVAPDEYGCADTVNCIHEKAFGYQIGGSVSTHKLFQALENSDDWSRVDTPSYGDIIISPTGYGNAKIPNGHVGIIDKDGKIMSNSSATGNFERNYTMEAWRNRYQVQGGYPVIFFRRA